MKNTSIQANVISIQYRSINTYLARNYSGWLSIWPLCPSTVVTVSLKLILCGCLAISSRPSREAKPYTQCHYIQCQPAVFLSVSLQRLVEENRRWLAYQLAAALTMWRMVKARHRYLANAMAIISKARKQISESYHRRVKQLSLAESWNILIF